jgi:hypothetical protein
MASPYTFHGNIQKKQNQINDARPEFHKQRFKEKFMVSKTDESVESKGVQRSNLYKDGLAGLTIKHLKQRTPDK